MTQVAGTSRSLKSWPSSARDVLLDAARHYYREMSSPWAIPDAAMEHAIEHVNEQLEARRDELHEEASRGWVDRWQRGALDAQMRQVIEETYRRLRSAERGTGSRQASVKKSRSQLDHEIAQALSARERRT